MKQQDTDFHDLSEDEQMCKDSGIEIDHNGAGVTEWEYRRYFDWLV